jgi:hypothetical protein cdivTM_02386
MGNSLTIISKKEKEELYKNLEGKWLIELDGNKIENEDDFAVAIMNEIDIVYDYKNLYGYDWYSFRDAAMESKILAKKMFGSKKTDAIIVYDNPRLDMYEIDRGFTYQYLISLLQWWETSLDTRVYFVIDNLVDNLENRIIIEDMLEKEKIIEAEKGKIIFEMDMEGVQLAEDFINQIDENLDFEEENDYVLIFTNSYSFVQGIHYHECSLMLIKLIEDILLKIRKEIKIYLLF